MDISSYPYFSFREALSGLMLAMQSQTDVKFLNFVRKHPNHERCCIILEKEHSVEWYRNGFYKNSLFENKDELNQSSAYYLWDSAPHTPESLIVKEHNQKQHNIFHGLTIVKKHTDYVDFFNFSSQAFNRRINNFYVTQKHLFDDFMNQFYECLKQEIRLIDQHRHLLLPTPQCNSLNTLSSRQIDCALLLLEGYSSKEIGKQLSLSYRTIDEYTDALKKKFKARNRIHLVSLLSNYI